MGVGMRRLTVNVREGRGVEKSKLIGGFESVGLVSVRYLSVPLACGGVHTPHCPKWASSHFSKYISGPFSLPSSSRASWGSLQNISPFCLETLPLSRRCSEATQLSYKAFSLRQGWVTAFVLCPHCVDQ